jgi:uncharacterized protein YbaP (TraB family)
MKTFNATRMTLLAALATALVGVAAAQPVASPVSDPPPAAPSAAPSDLSPAEEPIEEVLVAGERAGPGLWKVRKGDHTLFLLATITPAPKKIEWRSREVESVLARAQAFVPARPEVDTDIGPIKAVQLYMQYRKLRGNAEGERLEAVLPPPLFERFEKLRMKYAPRDRSLLERRPMLAVLELQGAAVERSGLTFRNDVARKVEKLARERKVDVLRAQVKVEDSRGTLAEVGQIPLPAEIACMEVVLGRIEADLANSRQRAEAWAVGDVRGLRSGASSRASVTCLDSLRNSARMAKLLRDFEDAWLGVVTRSLERNPVTLAVADIDGLLRPGGILAQLRARGYEIDEP